MRELLSRRRRDIVSRWFDTVVESYPAETAPFLKNRKSQFANPIGFTVSQAVERIFDCLAEGTEQEQIASDLDDIMRIRAVQDLSPSQALSFLFHLKRLVREEIGSDSSRFQDEITLFESRVDALALRAFDSYMKCREKIYDLKAKEVRNMTYRLLQKAQMVSEVSDQKESGE